MCGPCLVATSNVNANDNHNRILMHMHDVSVAHLPCVHICMHTRLRALFRPPCKFIACRSRHCYILLVINLV